LVVTFPAIDRAAVPRLEGNFGLGVTARADRGVHLALGHGITTVRAAFLPTGETTLGFVGEPARSEELLFGGAEDEFLAAISANDASIRESHSDDLHLGLAVGVIRKSKSTRILIRTHNRATV
jgi:hypothetical protein